MTATAAGAVAKQLLPLPLLCRLNQRRGDGAHVIPCLITWTPSMAASIALIASTPSGSYPFMPAELL